ncbi:MAG TPA: proline--tRNA ligase [Acidimicrobiales bacterium]|nr:proline--tRNA ligase [Acidimicrobiales bacterium]
MRMSRLFGTTLREAPAGVESVGHQFLLRAGYIRPLAPGIFSYLPLGWRALQRIEQVLREEMAAIGGVELSMPVVHPAEIWRRTGRYGAMGSELTRLRDRRDRDLVLAMTHEEVVATLAASEISSYRQLPKLVFQIQTKWRDDPRPRAGLIRAREFTMKDSYSLDADEPGLDVQYRAHYQAYFNIFNRCGLPVMAVRSDSGTMGGSLSHEYMYLNPLGEDTVVLCNRCGYAQNRQVATSSKPAPAPEAALPIERVFTPGAATIDDLVGLLDITRAKTAKIVFVAAEHLDDGGSVSVEPVVAVVRGDTALNESKLAKVLGAADLRPMTAEEIAAIGAVAGYASPMGLSGGTVVADTLVMASPNLVGGANEAGWHLRNTNAGRDWQPGVVADIVAAEEGDACSDCGHPLRAVHGVEVGNIFKLGSRYSAALGATYLDREGNAQPIVMGSYGIGVGRLLACIAEEHHDDRGLRLPVTIAPYLVHLNALQGGESAAGETARQLYSALRSAGIDTLFDDREERPGVQFADADLIGLPLRLTVSERSLRGGGIEVRRRDSTDSTIVPEGDVIDVVKGELAAMEDALKNFRN